MLVNMRDLLADARVGGYAVGSFSVANMEMVLGVLQAAEELRAPVILQICGGAAAPVTAGADRSLDGGRCPAGKRAGGGAL